MRNKFAHYYPTTKANHSLIWKDCVFVFDANVLLDLYRYSPSTSTELLTILDGIGTRLWLPHQVSLEFFRNRPEVIIAQENMFITAGEVLDSVAESARKEISNRLLFRDHPSIDKKQFLSDITQHLDQLKQQLEKKKKNHAQLLLDDPILQHILSLFENKVGDPFTQDQLEKVYSEGKSRYAQRVPPGYEDATGQNKKEGNDIYGDLVLWFQIVEHAKGAKKPIIFVSNDDKEDWWWFVKGRTIGFRPELADEMMLKANVQFYMYKSDRFMNYAREYLKVKVDDNSIREVQQVRENDEKLNQQEIADEQLYDYVHSLREQIQKASQSVLSYNEVNKAQLRFLSSYNDDMVKKMAQFKHDFLSSYGNDKAKYLAQLKRGLLSSYDEMLRAALKPDISPTPTKESAKDSIAKPAEEKTKTPKKDS